MMRLALVRMLHGQLQRRVAQKRAPDYVVRTTEGADYLQRWWVIPRNPFFNIYLHHFQASDDDRALHDHPWVNASLLLKGSYIEVLPTDPRKPAAWTVRLVRREGSFILRGPRAAHRIELDDGIRGALLPDGTIQIGVTTPPMQPVWTLFLTGPRVRPWGFWCPHSWRFWADFTAADENRPSGRGCE